MRWSLLASGSYSVVQAALVIRGFVIRGFNYPRLVNFVQNLLSAVKEKIIFIGWTPD